MRLRRETGDFSVVFTFTGVEEGAATCQLPNDLKAEDLIGMVVTVNNSDGAHVHVVLANLVETSENDETNITGSAGAFSFVYNPVTGVMTCEVD